MLHARTTRHRSSRGTSLATLTLIDQGLSSVSNFAVGVAIARVAGASGLGGFSLAYAGWLILASLHRSLITDPMAINGDVHTTDAGGHIEQGFAAELLLGTVGALIMAIIGACLWLAHAPAFGTAMLALAPWLPALTAQDYWRWVGFLTRRPGSALANDAVFNGAMAAVLGCLYVSHVHSIAIVIASWGIGAAAGAVYGLHQYRVRPAFRGGFLMLRDRWSLSKWLAGNSLLTTAGNQAYWVIAGVFLGPAGLGGLNAASTVVWGPVGVLLQAGGSIGLPEAGRAHTDNGSAGLRRVARLVTLVGIVAVGLWAAVVFGCARFLLTTIYGPRFAHLQFVAMVAAIGVCCSPLMLGPTMVLKITRHTRELFHIQIIISCVVSTGSVAVLSALYGIEGAAAALAVMGVTNVALLMWYQHRVRTPLEVGPPGGAIVGSTFGGCDSGDDGTERDRPGAAVCDGRRSGCIWDTPAWQRAKLGDDQDYGPPQMDAPCLTVRAADVD
jgi:O-antigen/teichoic acid export membrane protein